MGERQHLWLKPHSSERSVWPFNVLSGLDVTVISYSSEDVSSVCTALYLKGFQRNSVVFFFFFKPSRESAGAACAVVSNTWQNKIRVIRDLRRGSTRLKRCRTHRRGRVPPFLPHLVLVSTDQMGRPVLTADGVHGERGRQLAAPIVAKSKTAAGNVPETSGGLMKWYIPGDL